MIFHYPPFCLLTPSLIFFHCAPTIKSIFLFCDYSNLSLVQDILICCHVGMECICLSVSSLFFTSLGSNDTHSNWSSMWHSKLVPGPPLTISGFFSFFEIFSIFQFILLMYILIYFTTLSTWEQRPWYAKFVGLGWNIV